MTDFISKSVVYIKHHLRNAAISVNNKFKIVRYTLPDFLIIGAQKSGTTALYKYLIQHPGIIPAGVKEVNYFGNPHNRKKGGKWYSSHFCKVSSKDSLSRKLGYMPVTGEASPNMHRAYYPGFVHELLPEVKLIAILRNPVDRAYSQYQHNCRHGMEDLSFEDAIAQSPVQLPPEVDNDEWAYYNSTYRSYITRGLYAKHLEQWYRYYDKNSLHIINSDEFFSSPREELCKALEFLEMPDFDFKISEKPIHSGNYTAKMSDMALENLTGIFRPYNRKLFTLIGREFAWPS